MGKKLFRIIEQEADEKVFSFAVTMLIGMITHIRVKDPFSKSVPAFMLLVVSITLSTINFSE